MLGYVHSPNYRGVRDVTKTIDLEFFYDCSSPWTYFAFTRMVPMAERLGIPVIWRPILVGGVFNAVNQQVYAALAAQLEGPVHALALHTYTPGTWAQQHRIQ